MASRAQRLDSVMLPAVVALLLLGAVFVVAAWRDTGDAVAVAERKDAARAGRLAIAVSTVIEQRIEDLDVWVEENPTLFDRTEAARLGAELKRRVGSDPSSTTVAMLVVGADGSIAAIGEPTPGRARSNGIVDDVRALGRQVAARQRTDVSGRLQFGEEPVFAIAVPVAEGTSASKRPASAVVMVSLLDRSSIGAFVGARDTAGGVEGGGDDVRLLDSRGRVLVGEEDALDGDLVRRPVAGTGWSIEYARERIDTAMPTWAYPGFAALLVCFAAAYIFQDIRRRRLGEMGARRAAQVHGLYELAARVLHAETTGDQARDLVRSVRSLLEVDRARVHIEGFGAPIEYDEGASSPGSEPFMAAVTGPRGTIGELDLWRASSPLDDDERRVAQTAATLVGAALHTSLALETERAAAAELQRLDELRSNLLATVSHELLSPLTAVKGVLGLLAMQDDLGERGQEYVGVATQRTDRLVALIRDLFDCSLLETGQLDIRPRRQRADELLESALGAQAAAHPGELRLSPTPNLEITVDPIRFDQLVNNLVTNAFRHGSPPVEVAVRPGDGGVLVVVCDEGPGIPDEQRDEIFGKFWQASGGHARAAEGAGLGLSLVQGLVRLHGGDITVDSVHADGRGARFTAFFPDEVPAPAAAPGLEGFDATPPIGVDG